jgi:hypothetical protein
MGPQAIQPHDIRDQLELLEDRLRRGEVDFGEFYRADKMIDEARRKLQDLLECVAGRALVDRSSSKELDRLHATLAIVDTSKLIGRLKQEGSSVRKRKDLHKAFESQGFRIMEQTRASKRSSVHYALLRLYITHKERFPSKLLEPFKPMYSDDMFRVMIFSFLSGVLGKDEEQTDQDYKEEQWAPTIRSRA